MDEVKFTSADKIFFTEGEDAGSEKTMSMISTILSGGNLPTIELYKINHEVDQKEFDFDLSEYEYIAYDGHHRCAAYTILNRPIPFLETN